MTTSVKDLSYLRRSELEYEITRRGLKPKGTVNELIEQLRQNKDVPIQNKIAQPAEVSLAAAAIATAFEDLVDFVQSGVTPTTSQVRRVQARLSHYSDRISDLVGVDDELRNRFTEAREIIHSWVQTNTCSGDQGPTCSVAQMPAVLSDMFAKLKNPLQDKLAKCETLSVESVEGVLEVLNFTLDFERTSQALQMSSVEALQLMTVAAKGRLQQEFMKGLQLGVTWKDLRKNICGLVAPRACQELINDLYWREQGSNENINQYVMRVRNCVQAFELGFSEQQIVHHILGGFNFQARHRAVFGPAPNTFDELNDLVRHVQAVQMLDNRRQRERGFADRTYRNMSEQKDVHQASSNDNKPVQGKGFKRVDELVCWQCKTQGHVRRECPDLASTQPQL